MNTAVSTAVSTSLFKLIPSGTFDEICFITPCKICSEWWELCYWNITLLKHFKTYHTGFVFYYFHGIKFNSTFSHTCLSVVQKFVSWNSSVFAALLAVTTYLMFTVFINTNDTAIWRLMLCSAETHLFNTESVSSQGFPNKKTSRSLCALLHIRHTCAVHHHSQQYSVS